MPAGFASVTKLALALDNVEQTTTWGTPAFKVNGHLLACLPSHKSAEPDSLAVTVDIETRTHMIADAPDVYYVKPHYQNYPVVLVRLKKIGKTELAALLAAAHKAVSAKPPKRQRKLS